MSKRWTRMLPIMMITYMIAFMDRTNISFAIPSMAKELHLTTTILGFSSGILFLSYAASQPIGGLIADRGYGKPMVAIMMNLWGVAEIAQGLIRTPIQLVIVRGFLGLFEGCLMATFLLFVCNWFTRSERGRANTFWFLCFPVSAMLSGPIAGYILNAGSWRTLFIVEGFMPIIWSAVWLWGVSDSPRSARWISETDRAALMRVLANDVDAQAPDVSGKHAMIMPQFKRPSVLFYTAALLLWNVGFMGFIIWLPSVLHQDKSLNSITVGWLSALPFAAAVLVMIGLSQVSGKSATRHIYAAIPIGLCGVAFLVAGQCYGANSLRLNVTLMVIAGSMLYGSQPMLYSIPGDLVPAGVTASVIGIVNGFSSLGDFFGPYIIGYFRDAIGSYSAGLFLLGVCLIASSVLLCYARNKPSCVVTQARNHKPGLV